MILVLTAIDQYTGFRTFSCSIDSLEAAFIFLTSIVRKGDHLLRAEILDDAKRISLPTEAFDGVSLTKPLQQLECEWQQVLNEPVYAGVDSGRLLIELIHNQIKAKDAHLSRLEDAIRVVEQNIEKIQLTFSQEASRSKLLGQCENVLALYREQLTRTRQSRLLLARQQTAFAARWRCSDVAADSRPAMD